MAELDSSASRRLAVVWHPSRHPVARGRSARRCELIRMAAPEATVWVSDPTWPNHTSILGYLGMKMRTYRYFDAETRGVDFVSMTADLAQGPRPGDVVLLHGCCHNPTGANLTLPEWAEVADASGQNWRGPADRSGLSGLRRRTGGGRRRHPADRVALARGADCRFVLEELRHLPRAHRRVDGTRLAPSNGR